MTSAKSSSSSCLLFSSSSCPLLAPRSSSRNPSQLAAQDCAGRTALRRVPQVNFNESRRRQHSNFVPCLPGGSLSEGAEPTERTIRRLGRPVCPASAPLVSRSARRATRRQIGIAAAAVVVVAAGQRYQHQLRRAPGQRQQQQKREEKR